MLYWLIWLTCVEPSNRNRGSSPLPSIHLYVWRQVIYRLDEVENWYGPWGPIVRKAPRDETHFTGKVHSPTHLHVETILGTARVGECFAPFSQNDALVAPTFYSFRFYDAIVTDPPYNIKAKVVTTSLTTKTSGRHEEEGSVLPAARIVSEWKEGGGAKAEASAKDLVGKVIWSLLALARSSLKPGGRLCFFLPLRGAEARLGRLPIGLLEKMSQGDPAGGPTRLAVVYTTKQRMTSPNMCRWLIVLEKELDRPARDGEMDQT